MQLVQTGGGGCGAAATVPGANIAIAIAIATAAPATFAISGRVYTDITKVRMVTYSPEPRRVGQAVRIVVDIAVPVPALIAGRKWDQRIGRAKPANCRIINLPVHAHEADTVDHLMTHNPEHRDAA